MDRYSNYEALGVETLQARASGVVVRAVEFRTERQVLAVPRKTEQQVAAEQVLDAARKAVATLVSERANIPH